MLIPIVIIIIFIYVVEDDGFFFSETTSGCFLQVMYQSIICYGIIKKQTSTESNVFVCFIVSFSVFFSVGYKECRSGEYFTYRVARTKLEGTGMPISIKQDVAGRIGKSSS